MRKSIQCVACGLLAVAITGCVSMNGNMVNAEGKTANCSTKGGGIGLGMIIGAAVAATDNQLCESSMRDKGFLHVKAVGKSGITLPIAESDAPVIIASVPPAAPCLVTNDRIIKVGLLSAFFRCISPLLYVSVADAISI